MRIARPFLLKLLAGAMLAAANPALAADIPPRPEPLTLGDLAACAPPADEPICLLRLGVRTVLHTAYAQDIRLAYAPEVLAAVKDPAPLLDTLSTKFELHPGDRAAAAALLADHRGARPDDALSGVRAIVYPPSDDDAVRVAARLRLAAAFRVDAYQRLWQAAHGPNPLPVKRRPSAALLQASLAGWERDLIASERSPDDLIEAYLALGDKASAVRVVGLFPPGHESRANALLAAGMLDEAATEVFARDPALDAQSSGLAGVMNKAGELKRRDIAVLAAERLLHAAMESRGRATMIGLSASPALMTIIEFESAERAAVWTARLDQASETAHPANRGWLAAAASYGWAKLGRHDRAYALVKRWQDRPGSQLFFQAGVVIAGMSDDPPAGSSLRADSQKGRMVEVTAALAREKDAGKRARMLITCAQGAAGLSSAVALMCAEQLASAPPVEGMSAASLVSWKVDTLLYVALQAADAGDGVTARTVMAMVYPLAATAPETKLPRDTVLDEIAVGLLREQGRL